jgi:hypothetical protein
MHAQPGLDRADDRRKTDADKGRCGARPRETLPVQRLDQLPDEQRVTVVGAAGGGVGGEVVERRVQRGEGVGEEGLAGGVDVF